MSKEVVVDKIKISNPDKLLFNKPDISKQEIALYYEAIAPRMLPYIKNRIISTIRCPDGTKGECFYKKHLGAQPGLGIIELPSDKDKKEDYYYVINQTGIISEVQMNTIEFHIWGSTVNKLEQPDMMVFDLDPDEKLGLKELRQGARDLKRILDSISLQSFLKTSGGKGYHIVVPLKAGANWSKFREFAKNIAEIMAEKWPDRYTTNVRKINRKNRIFVDWIRNTRSATSVAPYSVRIKPGAPVSMPISWRELDRVNPDSINMHEAIRRVKLKDPWSEFFKIKQQLK